MDAEEFWANFVYADQLGCSWCSFITADIFKVPSQLHHWRPVSIPLCSTCNLWISQTCQPLTVPNQHCHFLSLERSKKRWRGIYPLSVCSCALVECHPISIRSHFSVLDGFSNFLCVLSRAQILQWLSICETALASCKSHSIATDTAQDTQVGLFGLVLFCWAGVQHKVPLTSSPKTTTTLCP